MTAPTEAAQRASHPHAHAREASIPENAPQPAEALSEVALPTTGEDTELSGSGGSPGTGSAGGEGSTPSGAPDSSSEKTSCPQHEPAGEQQCNTTGVTAGETAPHPQPPAPPAGDSAGAASCPPQVSVPASITMDHRGIPDAGPMPEFLRRTAESEAG